jgi:hypothetical protein
MSERLLEAFREEAEMATPVPDFGRIEAAGRARRRRRHAVAGAVAASVLAVTGLLAGIDRDRGDAQPAEDADETSLATPYPGLTMTTLEEGTYDLRPSRDPLMPAVRFTLPPGWNAWVGPNRFEGLSDSAADQGRSNGEVLDQDPDWYLGLLLLDVKWLAQPGCTMADLTGDSTAALAQALTDVPRLEVTSGPETTVRFGHPAVHLRLREGGKTGECLNEVFMNGAVSAGLTYLGRGTTYDAWVIDVDGRPLLLWAVWTRGTPRDEVNDLLGIVDSVELHDRE